MNVEAFTILLAEDDDGHASLIRRNLKRFGIVNEVLCVRDGQEALDCIRREGPFAGRAANGPLLLLLDINMPRLDGIEVLRQLKADEATAQGGTPSDDVKAELDRTSAAVAAAQAQLTAAEQPRAASPGPVLPETDRHRVVFGSHGVD